jgi:hypothetical protein
MVTASAAGMSRAPIKACAASVGRTSSSSTRYLLDMFSMQQIHAKVAQRCNLYTFVVKHVWSFLEGLIVCFDLPFQL